jgi:hypothetical protein
MEKLQPPRDRPVFEGGIATYWFDDGVLVSLSKPVKRTVALIAENVTFVKNLTGNRPVPLLIYLVNSPVPDQETRKFSNEKLPEIYSAMAMVSKPGLAQLIMKMVFRLKPPPIPVKSFTDATTARQWLQQFAEPATKG